MRCGSWDRTSRKAELAHVPAKWTPVRRQEHAQTKRHDPAARIEDTSMITHEQNEYLCGTNAGTPMGELFRRYWIPALMAEELPRPNCPPVRVQLLGERLVAFRDTQGRIGLMDEFCAHRGVSLWFG